MLSLFSDRGSDRPTWKNWLSDVRVPGTPCRSRRSPGRADLIWVPFRDPDPGSSLRSGHLKKGESELHLPGKKLHVSGQRRPTHCPGGQLDWLERAIDWLVRDIVSDRGYGMARILSVDFDM